MAIVLTGAAGFIGMHVAQVLLERGDTVVGIDNLNDYYEPTLKHARLRRLKAYSNFYFHELDIANAPQLSDVFAQYQVTSCINLAAQAGVRYSIEHPEAYVETNVVGFLNILECCRHNRVEHLVYASSSSVYGANEALPFSVSDSVDHPLSMYAATKKSNELMAHTYSALFGLPTTGLRFFTVYGPWGRPDMALFKFAKAMLAQEPIQVFNYGNHNRDFTFIDDIAAGVVKTHDNIAKPNLSWDGNAPDPGSSKYAWRVYNIGNSSPVKLMDYIQAIENALGCKAEIHLLPLQPGDVPDTHADVSALMADTGFKPDTPVDVGVKKFIDWYLEYYEHR